MRCASGTSMAGSEYRLLVTPPVQRGLDRLSEAAAAAVVEFLLGDFVREPRRVGKPLRAELSGTWSARRGPYQIVYTVSENDSSENDRSENDRTVAVLRIEHRADVYRQR